MSMFDRDDLLISLKRTLVPMIVGLVSGSFLAAYIETDLLEKFISGGIATLYYVLVRLLEQKLSWFGLLLGSRKQPVYLDPPK